MRNKYFGSAAALALSLVSPLAAAAVFKCMDAAGKTTYQAEPCVEPNGARQLNLGREPRALPKPTQVAPPGGNPAWVIQTQDGVISPDQQPPAPNRTMEVPERLEVPRVRIDFHLLDTDGRRLPWTNTGPKGGRMAGQVRDGNIVGDTGGPAVLHENGREAYALGGNGSELIWMPEGFKGPQQKLTPPATLPQLSWGAAMTWNTREGMLAIASHGGEGYFYRYDTRRHVWMNAMSLHDRDLLSLAFDAEKGNFVGLSDELDLLIFSREGGLQSTKPLANLLPRSAYNRSNPRLEALTVVARDGVVAIVKARKSSVTHIWTYDPVGNRVQLTYKD